MKLAPSVQVYYTVTSYTLETKQSMVPAFTNSKQASQWQISEETHFTSHPMWAITREAKKKKKIIFHVT